MAKRAAGSRRGRGPGRGRAAPRPDAALRACANVDDLEWIAKRRLPKAVYDYYAGGAEDEITLDANRAAFRETFLRPRALVGVGTIDTATSALGIPISMPVMVAPTAYQRMAHPDGELATARASGEAGTIMVASTISTASLEEIAKAATGPLWFQLYVHPDRAVSRDMARRAEAAGYRALCLTVDTPRLGRRERDIRNAFTLPPGITMRNFEGAAGVMPRVKRGSGFAAYAGTHLDATLTWDAVSWLAGETRLPIIVKGVIAADDARRAVDSGAAAVVVSNHGGRQLDACEPTIRALPHVAEAAAGRVEVYMDGGVRRGTDVIKAVALGARAVLIGRPVLWGLAAGGRAGVSRALELIREELALSMALCGCPTVASIAGELVAPPR
jgi:4-hydroxymandelate oxidase